jgi:DNA invertase Pin-like site-specific DNA recombinase
MRVVGYIRVSTREQAEEGYSLTTQREAIEAECERRGWELVAILADEGYSGRTDDRPALNNALRMLAKRNGPKAIVVARLDRLCRSITHLGRLTDESLRQKWGIVALDHELNTTTANGRLVAHIIGSVAQWESEMLGERVSRGMRAAHAAARAEGRPFGFQSNTPPEVVTRIVRARKRGDSFNTIAKRLDRTKTPTPNGGQRWYPSTVARIYKAAS